MILNTQKGTRALGAVADKLDHGIQPMEDVKKRLLWAMLATLLFSMLANGYSYFNFYPIHDAVDFTLDGPWREWQVQLGRFLIPYYYHIKTPISMPWITGLLSTAYLGMGVFLIVDILGLNTRMGITLVSGFMSANLFMLEINTAQQYFSDVFLFSMLFSCLGVHCLWKREGPWAVAAAGLCLFVSFGMYPAFITFAACLCMLAIIGQIVREPDCAKPVLRKMAVSVALAAVAGAFYLAVNRLAMRRLSVEPSTVKWSIYSVGQHSAAELWRTVKQNYILFCQVFFDGRNYVGLPFGVATCALAALGLAMTVRRLGKRVPALVCVAALLLLFPLVSRLVNVFTKMNGAFRTMDAQFLIWPALVAMVFWCLPVKEKRRFAAVLATTLLSLAIIAGNIRYTNGAFTVQRVLYERAVYHSERVLEDMKDFDMTKKVVVLGRFYMDTPNDYLMEKYDHINGFQNDTGVNDAYEFVNYAELLGYTLDWTPDYKDEAIKLIDYKAMPSYPDAGYIVELDDYLVVNLGRKPAKKDDRTASPD